MTEQSETDPTQESERRHDGLPDGIPDPDSPPSFEDDSHVLPEEDLTYPTLEFPSGTISQEEGFDLKQECDRDDMQALLDALGDGLVSHDVAVEAENIRATLGIAPDDIEVGFSPDDDHRGTLTVTLSLDAKVMRYEDADAEPIGNRGGRGFIPLAMLEDDRDPSEFRCYNWIDDPTISRGESDRECNHE
jgi:hypothetical protein